MATTDSQTFNDPDTNRGGLGRSFLPPDPSQNSSQGGIKVAIFLAFLLTAACLAGVGFIYQSLNSERRERIALEASNAQLEQERQTLKAKNVEDGDEIDRIREQLTGYSSEQEKWKKDLDASHAQVAELQKKIQALQAIAPTNPESESAPASGETAAAVPTGSTAKLPVAAKTQTTTQPAASTKTNHVMTVNRKFNFVVINLGLKDEMKMADKLEIVSGGKVIGTIQIEKLYDQFSAATIVEEAKDTPIKEGDEVRRLKTAS